MGTISINEDRAIHGLLSARASSRVLGYDAIVLHMANEISIRREMKRNPLATAGVILVGVFVLFALFAPWLAPRDPAYINLAGRLATPSWQHWMGTDELGRDILSRVIFGARISMLVGVCVVTGSLLLGTLIGSIAGYYGGRVDRLGHLDGRAEQRLAEAVGRVGALDQRRMRSWVEERFSAEAMISGYERAYERALAGEQAAAG